MLEQVCSVLRVSKELWADNGTNFCNTQVAHWQSTEWMRIYSPLYTPQANGVVKQTIGLVKNQIGKHANAE